MLRAQGSALYSRTSAVNDPYTVLGVARGCAPSVIKAAHRALISVAHPDRAGGSAARAAELNVAYTALTADRAYTDALLRVAPCAACKGTGTVTRQKGFKAKTRVPCCVCAIP